MDEVRSQDHNDEQISRLLRDMPAAEAPEDFEGMVRSRIVERRPTDRAGRPVLWLAVKFAAPLVLLLAFGVFLVLSDDGSLNGEMVAPVDAPAVASANLSFDEKPVNVTAANNLKQSQPLNRNAEQGPIEPPSQDKAVSPDDTAMFPPGVDPRKAARTNEKPSAGRIAPISILSFIGITSTCTPVSCEVRAVQPGALADRAGVRVGDIVEAIDDRPIDSTHLFSGEVSIRALRLRRDGKPLTIALSAR